MPSPRAALTSAPSFSSARTAATSPFIAASATGEPVGAAPTSADMTHGGNQIRAKTTHGSTPSTFKVASSRFNADAGLGFEP